MRNAVTQPWLTVPVTPTTGDAFLKLINMCECERVSDNKHTDLGELPPPLMRRSLLSFLSLSLWLCEILPFHVPALSPLLTASTPLPHTWTTAKHSIHPHPSLSLSPSVSIALLVPPLCSPLFMMYFCCSHLRDHVYMQLKTMINIVIWSYCGYLNCSWTMYEISEIRQLANGLINQKSVSYKHFFPRISIDNIFIYAHVQMKVMSDLWEKHF